MEPILLFDTTLRDGTQGENVSFSAEEKVKVAKKLDNLGVHYIEGGWPGSNPRDVEFFELAKKVAFKQAKLTAFGSTRRPGIRAEDDLNLNAIIETGAPCAAIFGKTWDLHVEVVMENTLEENLTMIRDSVAFLKDNGLEVVYDAEHFFDGYKKNREYALQTLAEAVKGGADYLVLCDTNGGTLPYEIQDAVVDVKTWFAEKEAGDETAAPVRLGIHAHNDCGVAVANSIAAIREGAVMVHGTINGYGERCGNADLTTIIPILREKMGLDCISKEKMTQLRKVSRFVCEIANLIPLSSRPFIGKSAFAHKGGIHVSAVQKTPAAYEHMDPEKVGNGRRVLVSDLSGKSNIAYKAKELGIELGANGFDEKKIVEEIKQLEHMGYQYEAADGSLEILMEKFTEQFTPLFSLESFRITIEKSKERPCRADATIKILVNGKKEITAAEGQGPVSALDNALRKALNKFYPGLDAMRLTDFKVRVIDGRAGTAAKVRVFIESRDKVKSWNTIGVSEDIIEASWQALADSFQYKLAAYSKGAENGDAEEEESAGDSVRPMVASDGKSGTRARYAAASRMGT